VGILEKGILVASGSLEDIRRQAHQDKILRIKVLSNPVEAETLLLDQPGVTQVYPIDEPLGDGSGDGLGTEPPEDDQVQTKNPLRSNGHLLEVEFQGDAAATADLLEALITHKVRVASLGEVGTDLEEIFLRLTRGEVA
jgi:ABC-2 type transport system ATP-binding protein